MFLAIRGVRLQALSLFCALPLLGGCSALARKSGEAKPDVVKKEAAPWNAAILTAIDNLPLGGGYSVSTDARDALHAGIAWEDEKPVLRPKVAQPSFCSGATYMAFLVALAQQQRAGRLTLTPDVWRSLIVSGQADGEGVWGRWNANGPGTARLFYQSGAGRNFTDPKEAVAGDFLKIFWNDSIGASEKGHSVVFLAVGSEKGEETVTFWSSNQPGGYGTKQVPRSRIKRMVFSRLENPDRLSGVLKLEARDGFLASLEEKSVSPEEAAKLIGLKKW